MSELVAGMPLVALPTGYQVVFEAIDPTTGAAVADVEVSAVTVTVDAPESVRDEAPPEFVPLFVYTDPGAESPGLTR